MGRGRMGCGLRVRAVWCGCGLGGCAGGVRGFAPAVCRETRAEHDAAAINTGPPSRLAAAERERSRPMRGATRGRVLAWCPPSQPLALLLCAVRVQARMSNKSTSQCSQSQVVRSESHRAPLFLYSSSAKLRSTVSTDNGIVVWLFPLLQASYRQVNRHANACSGAC